ncbi:PIN domain-containing protein [Anaerosinus massiliensis]|uniref:PIN domain protein n=1 Tax=Massilibacillus massiliensis TaxID=1806837 RepID=UPI000AF58541|nr:PIN domain protein [Massilibacillus massiliensis]
MDLIEKHSKTTKLKIYLDNCCFNRPFDDQTQLKIHLETQAKLYVQAQILKRELDFVWSYILEYENMQNPFEIRRQSIILWKDIATETVIESKDILTFAETLKTKGIKTKDALHISCAVASKCDYYLTTDKKLLNKDISEIDIINPIELISRLEVE